MTRVLIAYSTVDGQTLRIAEHIAQRLRGDGHTVTLAEIGSGAPPQLSPYDKIVVGASIRYGHHRKEVYRLVEASLPLLQKQPTAFFSVNLVARKPGKADPERNAYLRGFLRRTRWAPTVVAAFAGTIDYARYGLADRLMIQFIMWLTGGPTDAKARVEFTDWAAVDDFARRVASLPPSPTAAGAIIAP
jgi:menaquinone-dependent protoporphyrinogen oxidase